MKNFFINYQKEIQTFTLILGSMFIGFGLYDSLLEHSNDFNKISFIIVFFSFIFVYLFITYFTHNHTHKKELKALIFTEFIHSLLDGAIIGFAFYVNPSLGVGTLLSVFGHELPKIFGTYLIIISEVKTFLKSIKYLVYTQVGLPISAFIFYYIGTEINEKYHEALEAVALASLFAIVIRLLLKTFNIHRKHN